jgi:membrane protease YdiL (CAAX protease family)
MAGFFALSAHFLGAEAGYLLSFGFYWLVWCLLVPRWLMGKAKFTAILHDHAPLFSRSNRLAAALWIFVMLVAILMYAGDFIRAPLALIVLAVPLATVNGFCEEILWRGLYIRLFPHNPWLALGFALWHFAPQLIFPAENIPAFVISTFFLSLPYGYIAYRTGSAKETAFSHSLSGILDLGRYLTPGLLAVFRSPFGLVPVLLG